MTSSARVSVIVPVYNAGRLLEGALRSIRSQGSVIGETIVVNDGSTDDVHSIVARYRGTVRVLTQSNSGPAAARNRGIGVAREPYIAFLDADDLWTTGSIPRAVSRLRETDAHGVHGLTALLHARCSSSSAAGGPRTRWVAVGRPWRSPQLGSLVVRATAFARVGPFDESLHSGEDFDWFVRARELFGSFEPVDRVILRYRVHAGSTTRAASIDSRNTMLVLKRALDRRRALAGKDSAC